MKKLLFVLLTVSSCVTLGIVLSAPLLADQLPGYLLWIVSNYYLAFLSLVLFLILSKGVREDSNTHFLVFYGIGLGLKILGGILLFALIRKQYDISKAFTAYYFLLFVFYTLISVLMIETKKPA